MQRTDGQTDGQTLHDSKYHTKHCTTWVKNTHKYNKYSVT